MKRSMDAGRLASELAGLPHLDRDTLVERWRALYRTDPPPRIGNGFLIHAIAYRMQEQVFGGIKPTTQRTLSKIVSGLAGDGSSNQKNTVPTTTIKAGTRLLREWHGVTYEVHVMENGVRCNDVEYRSLSQVARVITGTKWSGPVFFGLKSKRVT